MIPIYLCEDNIYQLKYLEKEIRNIILTDGLNMVISASTETPDELLSYINGKSAENGIYFLDIELKSRINGIELATEIRKYDPRAFIIFVTTHDEMMLLTFQHQVEPLDYIIKNSPDFTARIHSVIYNILDKYRTPDSEVTDTLTIASGRRPVILPKNDIYYIEFILPAQKIAIHTSHGIIEIIATLKDLTGKLDDRFIQCHKEYIVNCNHIRNIDEKTYTIYFNNNQICPCSAHQYHKIIKRLPVLT